MLFLITTTNDIGLVNACKKEGSIFDRTIFINTGLATLEAANIRYSDIFTIALKQESDANNVKTHLHHHGISSNHIIDFYKIYRLMIPPMRADRIMKNPKIASFEGLILGLSHSEVGIIGENLTPKAGNLSVSSQDLFYNYCVFRYVTEEYKYKLENLQYFILEMYKYNYFNYDASKSKMMPQYLHAGGYDRDPHHFAENKNFPVTWDDLLAWMQKTRLMGVTEIELTTWAQLFSYNIVNTDESLFSHHRDIADRGKIVSNDDLNSYNYNPANVRKHFEKTIEENIIIFDQLLSSVRKINKDIRIFVIQMPIYSGAWKRAKEYYLPWKAEFESIINKSKETIEFSYIDMTEHPIAEEREFWFDAEHLNYSGAIRFTENMNALIMSE